MISILFWVIQNVIVTFQSFEILRKLDCPDPEIQTRYVIKFTVVSLKNTVPHFSKRENLSVFWSLWEQGLFEIFQTFKSVSITW